jgi:hypothetical protein
MIEFSWYRHDRSNRLHLLPALIYFPGDSTNFEIDFRWLCIGFTLWIHHAEGLPAVDLNVRQEGSQTQMIFSGFSVPGLQHPEANSSTPSFHTSARGLASFRLIQPITPWPLFILTASCVNTSCKT